MKYEFINEGGGFHIPIPQSYADCLTLVKSDWFRYSGINPSLLRIIWGCRNVHTGFSFWLRFSSYKKGLFHSFCKRMLARYDKKYGLSIESSTKIGYGLYLGHRFGIIVNPTAIIGNNVNLSQFSTIGSNEGKAAIIGDNVYIGPNVCIVEDIVIGNNTAIGAGAVVVKTVPPGNTVAGCPAKVISYKDSSRFILNKWCLPHLSSTTDSQK